MRALNSVKNSFVSLLMSVVTILIGLITQKIFIQVLGTEYLGLNGLFNNILSMLTIAELGIGTAIIYSLYEPLAHKEYEKIKMLLKFYKNSYRIISLIIGAIGILLIPFLPTIVGENNISENITFLYLLFLCDTIFSYWLTYKRAILQADEKTYIINIIHIFYLIFMNTVQVILLLITKNYICYLIVKIMFRIIENLVITFIANKKYPYICDKNVSALNREEKSGILKKVKGLLFHKIGGFVVNGTDNIIISTFLGIATVGLYTNYYTIIGAVGGLFSQVFSSITASVGHLLTENNKIKNFVIYKNMLFINFWIYCFSTVALLCMMEPFISIWIGSDYLLATDVLIVLCINFYFQGMRKTIGVFKDAAGIFHKDRYMPIFESCINIVVSIVFVKLFGLKGVFLGTITSTLFLYFYGYPKYVYTPLFQRSTIDYLKEHLKYFLVLVFIGIFTFEISRYFTFFSSFEQLCINALIVFFVPNILMWLFFHKKEEFQYVKYILSLLFQKNRKDA